MQALDFEINAGLVSTTVTDSAGVAREIKRQGIVRGRVVVREKDIVIEVYSTDPVKHPAMVVANLADGDLVVAGSPVVTLDAEGQAEVDRLAREALRDAPRAAIPPTPFVAQPWLPPVTPAFQTDAERLAWEASERDRLYPGETAAQRAAREALHPTGFETADQLAQRAAREREIAAGRAVPRSDETTEQRLERESREREAGVVSTDFQGNEFTDRTGAPDPREVLTNQPSVVRADPEALAAENRAADAREAAERANRKG